MHYIYIYTHSKAYLLGLVHVPPPPKYFAVLRHHIGPNNCLVETIEIILLFKGQGQPISWVENQHIAVSQT